MNIFWLSLNLKKCARLHCDKHVVKCIIEYAQLLCSAHHILDGDDAIGGLYKSTHKNHPCTIWTREKKANYDMLYELFTELCNEYTYRYSKQHKTCVMLCEKLRIVPKNIPDSGPVTDLPVAITNKNILIYDTDGIIDTVKSYRNYYKVEKVSFAKWKKRKIPYWMLEN